MGKSISSSVRINGPERMRNEIGGTNAEADMATRLTSFILAWLLAVIFCLVFWYGVYLLIRSFIAPLSWEV